MHNYATGRTAVFNRHASQHHFTEAEQILETLRTLDGHFPNERLVNLGNMEATLQTARTQQAAQQNAEEEAQREREGRQRAEAAAQRAEEEVQQERNARENLAERMNVLERELRDAQNRNMILPAAIMGAAHVIGRIIERDEENRQRRDLQRRDLQRRNW